jgi:hypothetical protein
MQRRFKLIAIAGVMAVTGGVGILAEAALAQHAKAGGLPQRNEPEPFNIETFGEFRNLLLRGDFGVKAVVGEVMSRFPSIGVGAVSAGRGEITIADGRLIISYGKSDAHPSSYAETAALLATATVKEWQAIQVISDVAPAALDGFLAQTAKTGGLDPDKTFPFQLRGAFGPYAMHVNIAPTGGPYGMGLPMALTVERKGADIAGSVAGLYVSLSLVGIVSHGGERTHAHWIAADGASTAHLDTWGIKAGTTLLLPKPE